MITTTESLYGPHRWGRYDILVLPPSFPFGGMENPRLTFATPTVIAGDKSLVSLVAHELAHSWSGNLVTNATWHDFWLNEGFTTYLERRIVEALRQAHGRHAGGDWRRDLADARKTLPVAGDRTLLPDLTGRDPDDAFSNVPHEQGQLFLVFLESKFGRDAFDAFLRNGSTSTRSRARRPTNSWRFSRRICSTPSPVRSPTRRFRSGCTPRAPPLPCCRCRMRSRKWSRRATSG